MGLLMVGMEIHIRRPPTRLSERTINIWYAVAILSGIPGMVLYLQGSFWWAPVASLTVVVALVAAALGFLNRQRPLDTGAAIGMVLYAIILGLVAWVGWVLEWSDFLE